MWGRRQTGNSIYVLDLIFFFFLFFNLLVFAASFLPSKTTRLFCTKIKEGVFMNLNV